jgi:hypothetical protein
MVSEISSFGVWRGLRLPAGNTFNSGSTFVPEGVKHMEKQSYCNVGTGKITSPGTGCCAMSRARAPGHSRGLRLPAQARRSIQSNIYFARRMSGSELLFIEVAEAAMIAHRPLWCRVVSITLGFVGNLRFKLRFACGE